MSRLIFIVIFGALMLSANLQRAESFSHHRISVHDKDSDEHLELDDSNELHKTDVAPRPIDNKSDEQVDSDEEKRIVKRHVLRSDHSSEEENAKSLESKSDEHDDDVVLVKLVKRDIESTTADHSSEEYTTADNQSVEEDNSREKRTVKRNFENTVIDHSSEEVDHSMNQSDEHDDSKELVKREIQQLTAEELEMLFHLFNSQDEDFLVGFHSNEYDYFSSIEKRHAQLPTTGGHSSEEDTSDHSFENSIEDA